MEGDSRPFGKKSFRMEKVTPGIQQCSVLGLTLSVLFINDLPQVVISPVALFAEETNVV